MAEKLNAKVVSLSLASVSGILSLLCALLIAIAPEAAVKFFGSIFHGIDIAKIAIPITPSGVLIGLIAVVIVALITGWLFAVIYNYALEKLG